MMYLLLCTPGTVVSSAADTSERVFHTRRDGGGGQVQEGHQEETQVTQEGRRYRR